MLHTKYILPFIIIFLSLSSCQKRDDLAKSKSCMVEEPSYHSKASDFQHLMDKYQAKGIPGITLLIKDTEGIWYGASGYADIAENIPMEACHINKVASLTKIFMGALTLKLAEEGKINLYEKVNAYLSEKDLKNIANANDITVIDLLKHTTGIFDVITDNNFYLSVLNDPPAHRNQEDILKFVRGKDALFPAGEKSSYSNTNTLLLSMIIDKITGKSHATLLKEYIIHPLGLEDSYYYYHDALPEGKVAQGYYDLFNNGNIVNVSNYNTGSGNGYTGLYTNVFDLLYFSEALFENKNLVSSNSLETMLDFDMPLEEGAKRYLGAGTMKDFIDRAADEYAWGHRGRDLGYSADMFYFPEKEKTLIFIVNYGTNGESALRPLFFELREKIVDKLME